MLVSEAVSELRNIDALDLTTPEATRLLNEANVELCVRARWTRKTLTVDSIAGTDAYIMAGMEEPREVYVGGVPYSNTDYRTILQLRQGDLRLRARGLWWLDTGTGGSEWIGLYPAPSQDGIKIEVLSVVAPDELGADDQFTPPHDFHHAMIEYVQGVSIGGSEDDVDRRGIHWAEFERAVARLRARRITRDSGRGPATMRISGVTA